jgi:AraC-like DNA-binding protein
VTPKRFCRILRFQRAVTQAHSTAGINRAEVALACGYFDQPHLIHDFRAFAGMIPTAYEASRTAFRNHVNVLQASDE